MSNISKSNNSNIKIELSSISVVNENGNNRGYCWNFDVNNEFPIIPVNTENGEVILEVGIPHKGYSIESVMKNGKMNGISRILNEKEVKIASLTFVDGIANGVCILYDSIGRLYFEGYFVNGYREGKGKEYDENGNVMFDGFFKEGKRMNIVELKEMNEKNEMISICKKDEEGRNEGICYFYVNGNIDHISEWKNDKEVNVLKHFEGKK